jgi:hypothetical protein
MPKAARFCLRGPEAGVTKSFGAMHEALIDAANEAYKRRRKGEE